MKKLLLLSMLIIGIAQAKAQKSYYYKASRKTVTYQIVPTVMNFEGTKFGFGIGANIGQIVSVNYFHLRDYDFSETYMDNRFAGVHLNAVVPVVENIEVGGGMRYGTLNEVWQKPLYSAEARLKFSDVVHLAFEYGKSDGRNATSLRLLFNIY